MALFGSQRDAKFLAAINSELINAIIDTEILYYKLIVEQSDSNIYGESEQKSFYNSILMPCIITKENKSATMDDHGHSYTRTAQFALSRDLLETVTLYPEVGDIIFWDNEYYEIDNVESNQYFVGKNPDYPNSQNGPNPLETDLAEFGYNVSIICSTHYIPADKVGLSKERT